MQNEKIKNNLLSIKYQLINECTNKRTIKIDSFSYDIQLEKSRNIFDLYITGYHENKQVLSIDLLDHNVFFHIDDNIGINDIEQVSSLLAEKIMIPVSFFNEIGININSIIRKIRKK